jgi:hypothetical protein
MTSPRPLPLLLFLLSLPLLAAPPATQQWRLAFSDEFNSTQLDTKVWDYRLDTRLWSLQTAENVSVSNGHLHLHLRKQKSKDLDYSAGGIITKQRFHYGYYEARLRIPKSRGWHTSFWLMQNNDTRANENRTNEIDICEQDSVNPSAYTVNWHNYSPSSAYGYKRIDGPNLSDAFHTFAANVTPNQVDFYLDDQLVHTIPTSGVRSAPANIWLTSIAAALGGATSVEDSKLPDEAVFDWVRYYEPQTPPTRTLRELNLSSRLAPLPDSAQFIDPEYYIWCGSAVRGDDGLYHLYYSRWPRKLGHYAWVTHSEIAHATSPSPTGPFRHVNVALKPRGKDFWDGLCTHNPTILRIGNKYYLYYMGNTGDGLAMPTLNWTHRNKQRIGVAVAESPNGPWQRFDQPVLDVSPDSNAHDALMTSNPSVAVRPDGGVLMVYKAVGKQRPMPFGGPVVHLTATADSPTGPFTKQNQPIFLAPGVDFPAEDPFLWFSHAAQRYYAVVKDNNGHFTKAGKSLALWQSTDGFAWQLAPNALVTATEFKLPDGSTKRVNSLERPQLLFAPNGEPIALLAAVDEDSKREHSYNVQIPIR